MSSPMSRSVAGYHMLMILSAVDGRFNGKEDKIIRQFMEENLGQLPDLESEMEIISAMKSEDYAIHFNKAMNDFYMDSTLDQRNHFLDMATRLVAADKQISKRENLFLNELYNACEYAREI